MYHQPHNSLVGYASTPNLRAPGHRHPPKPRLPYAPAPSGFRNASQPIVRPNPPHSSHATPRRESFHANSTDPDLIHSGHKKDPTQVLQLPTEAPFAGFHSREASGSTTYNMLGFYADDDISELDESDMDHTLSADEDSLYFVGSDTHRAPPRSALGKAIYEERMVNAGTRSEPFTLISASEAEAEDEGKEVEGDDSKSTPTDASKPTSAKQTVKTHKAITKKESYAAMKESRLSLERVRSKLGKSMATDQNGERPAPHLMRMHRTTKNSILKSDLDRYGFKKTNTFVSQEDYDRWWVPYSQYLIKWKRKWEKLMAKNGLPTDSHVAPTRFPPRSENLRKFVRRGIPAEWRGNAWFYFAKGHEKLRDNRGVYDRLVDQTMDVVNENTEAIEKDLHRTFPENVHFKNVKTEDGGDEESALLQTLRRVLKCFSIYKPSVGYCQSLNFIAGLLLIFMDEEKAFWMLVLITEKYLPGIHDLTLEGVNVHQGVLMLCLRQFLPDVWDMIVDKTDTRYMEGTNSFLYDLPALSFCTTSWFMSMFIGVLPTETTLRVWDCLFYDDSKTIFQIALTIFKLMEPDLKRIVERSQGDEDEMVSSELFQVIQNFPKRILDANMLLLECFKYSKFSGLTQEEIAKCNQYVIESRARYHSLIKKRSAVGMNESDRKELIRSSEMLENNKIGLKTLTWNGKLNHRMRRLQHRLK